MPNIRCAALRSRYAWTRQPASPCRRPATASFGSRAPHRAQQRARTTSPASRDDDPKARVGPEHPVLIPVRAKPFPPGPEETASDGWPSPVSGPVPRARRVLVVSARQTPTPPALVVPRCSGSSSHTTFASWARHDQIQRPQVLPQDEGPGILHWLTEGARRYLATRDTLAGPDRVRIATSAYANTEDHICRFLTECCIHDPDNNELRAEQGLLYASYRRFCRTILPGCSTVPRAEALMPRTLRSSMATVA